MKQHLIILNPQAGRGLGAKSQAEIETQLRALGVAFDLVRTTHPGHAIALAEEAAGKYEVVVAAGGDGTVNETLNGLVRASRAGHGGAALGVICVGRGNDFAAGVNIPNDLAANCQALAQGRRQRIDVGLARGGDYPAGRYFGNGIGIGFDAVVGFEALKLKRLSGFPSYIVAALKTIFVYFHAPTVRIEFNGEKLEQGALMVSVMNGRRMGGGFWMAPQGRPDDGEFDLCIAGSVSKAKIFALIPRFMQGTQASHPAVRMGRTHRVTITAIQGTLPAHADGETLCTAGERLEVEIIPGALEVVVPA